MLAGIFYGAMYGGSTTSILVNIPGEAASVVTCLDGHALAQRGAGRSSTRDGGDRLVSGRNAERHRADAVLAAADFRRFAFRSAREFRGDPARVRRDCFHGAGLGREGASSSWRSASFSACIGIDQVSGEDRFTFGFINLTNGFDLVPVVIGLFGVSEILLNMERSVAAQAITDKVKGLLPTLGDWAQSWKAILRGSFLGFGVGILPGGSPVTASFVSYALERSDARQPERFGKGAIEGVAGPELANNSAVAGGMIPLLSLGLPGNSVTALLLGALIIQNITPGPLLASQRPDMFWGVIASMYLGNMMLLVLNLPLIGLVGSTAARALSHPVSARAASCGCWLVLGKQEHLRLVGHARLRRWRLCVAQARVRTGAICVRTGPRATTGTGVPSIADHVRRQSGHLGSTADHGRVAARNCAADCGADSRLSPAGRGSEMAA